MDESGVMERDGFVARQDRETRSLVMGVSPYIKICQTPIAVEIGVALGDRVLTPPQCA